jgi:ParB family transcriptional regulator, chromosome partitioning protein
MPGKTTGGLSPRSEKSESKKAEKPKPETKRRRKKGSVPQGLAAAEVAGGEAPEEIRALGEAVRACGGGVVGAYRDPLGGHWQLIASLPVDQVEPTPFQRDLSETHVKRLGEVVSRMGRFLDPIIAVRSPGGMFWTPNGNHRLAAMRAIGARSILLVIVPEISVAYQILAMNTEKGHNLREKSLEVIRMARSLAEIEPRRETEYALEFEEPAFLTLGITYEQRGRFSGGAYNPVLRRVETFLDSPLPEALATRAERAGRLLELDDKVTEAVAALRERGLTSPYLKAFVVARLNPLRFRRGATMEADEALAAMMSAAQKFDADKIKMSDLAAAPPGPSEE